MHRIGINKRFTAQESCELLIRRAEKISKTIPQVASHIRKGDEHGESRTMAFRYNVHRHVFDARFFSGSYPVEIRPSPIHGRGVFAAREIREGEILSIYRISGLFTRDMRTGKYMPTVFSPGWHTSEEMLQNAYKINEYEYVVGDVFNTDHPALIGQMVNDAGYDPFDENLMLTEEVVDLDQSLLDDGDLVMYPRVFNKAKYNDRIRRYANAHTLLTEHMIMTIQASRDIAKDEEVLINYGVGFWERFMGIEPISNRFGELHGP